MKHVITISNKINQTKLVNDAVKKAGSVDALALKMNVSRQTIFKWRNGQHEMKFTIAMELLKWVNRKESFLSRKVKQC